MQRIGQEYEYEVVVAVLAESGSWSWLLSLTLRAPRLHRSQERGLVFSGRIPWDIGEGLRYRHSEGPGMRECGK